MKMFPDLVCMVAYHQKWSVPPSTFCWRNRERFKFGKNWNIFGDFLGDRVAFNSCEQIKTKLQKDKSYLRIYFPRKKIYAYFDQFSVPQILHEIIRNYNFFYEFYVKLLKLKKGFNTIWQIFLQHFYVKSVLENQKLQWGPFWLMLMKH